MSCRRAFTNDKKKWTDRIEKQYFYTDPLKVYAHASLLVFLFSFFHFVCNHLEAVAECVSTSCPSKTYTVPWWVLQPGALLFAIRVVLVLAVLAQWLCGWCWKCSRAAVAGRGLFLTTHVAAIKSRKGPCSREQCYRLLEIPWRRWNSVWIHFHLAEQKRRQGEKEVWCPPTETRHKWFLRLTTHEKNIMSFINGCSFDRKLRFK